jgi:hypothetical protein
METAVFVEGPAATAIDGRWLDTISHESTKKYLTAFI